MKLADFLRREGVTYAEFGRRVGRTCASVSRWCSGHRIPDKGAMHEIVSATGGEVTANDFFDITIQPESTEP